jgi:ABC-2 type transport system ATP-binding protein
VILELTAVTRTFAGRRVLGPVDLELGPGERLALTGPNGSGKSTLLRCIAGTLAPSAGTLTVGGARAGTRLAREQIGASFSQERSFYQRLTGRENLLTFACLRAPVGHARAQVDGLITELDLQRIAAMRMDRCSTGMVQQLALARALLGAPGLLLLDEPTRSLDDAAIERLWAALGRRPSLALIIATHRDEDIECCDRHLALKGR